MEVFITLADFDSRWGVEARESGEKKRKKGGGGGGRKGFPKVCSIFHGLVEATTWQIAYKYFVCAMYTAVEL